MKFSNMLKDEQIKAVTLGLLLVTAIMGWLTNGFMWFAASIMIVSVALILHGINDFLTEKKKTKGIVVIIASSLFAIFNIVLLWM
ncbi:hypothetical protein CN918_30870 [Priestia megaterium]|nr:hypothetical protein CN918_30870 [Priestia megaterium]